VIERGPTHSQTLTNNELLTAYPVLTEQDPNTILIIGQHLATQLQPVMKNYIVLVTPPNLGSKLSRRQPHDSPVAFIPAWHNKIDYPLMDYLE
jgi:hypothetical protein